MKWIISSTLVTTLVCTSSVAFAHCKKHHHCHHHAPPPVVVTYKDLMPSFMPSWYVGGHVGVSRTHDDPAVNSGDSVTQIGPGWTVDLGYRFYQFYRATLAGELGYTQYHNSNETLPGVNVASTEHFASYLALVAEYPLCHNFNVLGKLGVAYSYAKKVFTTGGASASANTYSPYYGLGVSYNMTDRAELVLQWARVRGDHSTGSTDLTSLGVTYSL